ncbi:hypothetical protein EW026_g5101 [Hermanssonia centrifuga]|uniref:Sugar phosphate phosphatase n=1 Tax=Hermanssonia centrifuga TaxID=98765 RepID=A0A4S4KF53_9APHY|nr:hypothetical protein EW026_g5101 [Hermanssonia centrifuga]
MPLHIGENATDLSLLTHLSHDDIANLQSVGRDAQAARREYILKDDQENVWEYLKSLRGKNDDKKVRVDFVLDNAGFELFTDLVFADFLVTYTPYVSQVIFQYGFSSSPLTQSRLINPILITTLLVLSPKLIPWFVSDVTPPDFLSTIPSLLSETFFPSQPPVSSATEDSASIAAAGPDDKSKPPSTASVTSELGVDSRPHLREMVERWQRYLDNGTFGLSVPLETPIGAQNDKADFWTSPWPYWELKDKAPEIYEGLQASSLVIFKGDLNYRKLTGDVRWPVSTPFETAVGPLNGSFPILSLRTNKADVAVGVPQEVADKLDAAGEKWRVNGRYALVSFLPKSE